MPDNIPIPFEYRDGVLQLEIPAFHIHTALVIM